MWRTGWSKWDPQQRILNWVANRQKTQKHVFGVTESGCKVPVCQRMLADDVAHGLEQVGPPAKNFKLGCEQAENPKTCFWSDRKWLQGTSLPEYACRRCGARVGASGTPS